MEIKYVYMKEKREDIRENTMFISSTVVGWRDCSSGLERLILKQMDMRHFLSQIDIAGILVPKQKLANFHLAE